MASEQVEQLVTRAVQQSYQTWAAQHPSLAAVIDEISLTTATADSLRKSPEYAQAVQAFYQTNNELEFLNRLVAVAEPIIRSLLGN